MAEAVASKVLRKLAELVAQEAIFLFGVREKFEWVKTELEWIKSFLRDADAKEKKDERVKKWVHEVIDVFYQAEDAIDSFLLLLRPTQLPCACFLDCITSITPCQLMERHRIGVEIERIKGTINGINSRRQAYLVQSLGEDAESSVKKFSAWGKRSPSQGDDVDMVGHHGVYKAISKQLIDQLKQQQQLCFTCIYGTGGLGKTTLARKIFHSNDVQRHFPMRIWMVVTHFSGSKELLAKIIKDVTREEITNLAGMEVENFTEKMKESLGDQEKRCLIVLDDVWEEHKDVCGLVQRLFRSVMNGSRVLVTTRSKQIAEQTDTCTAGPYELEFLNRDESVELLLKKAFRRQDVKTTSSCPEELFKLAPLLAKRCGGLPLALSVLGGQLSRNEKSSTRHVWKNLAEKMNWASHEGRECQEILALSYEALEYDLKPCFLYLGMFPQDHVISASLLVKLWVAEGFVEDEDKGDDVLEELIQRSLVQVNERKPDGSVKKCSVHDLLLELAKNEAENNGFLRVCTSELDIRDISGDRRHTRRVAFQGAKTTNEIEGQTVLPGLRTLMQLHSIFKKGSSLLFRSEFLRVIELQNVALPPKLPAEIKSMKLLRYLGLRETGVKELPAAIGDLQNLQSIDLRGCKDCIIPSTLFKIKTLRHVQTEVSLRPPPNLVLYDIKTLERVAIIGSSNWVPKWKFPKLQKLSLTEVGRFHGRALVTVLAELNHLVVLKITGECIPSEVDLMAFEFHPNLQSLFLYGAWPRGDAFHFPTYLRKIDLGFTQLEQDPMPKLERLHYLLYVKLYNYAYIGKTMTCSADGFPVLESLEIAGLRSLEEWKVEKGAMAKLKKLDIWGCRKLKMPSNLQHVQHVASDLRFDPLGALEELCRKLVNDTG